LLFPLPSSFGLWNWVSSVVWQREGQKSVNLTFPFLLGNVADPGCLSRIWIFFLPGYQTQQKGVGHKFHKIENYLIFEQVQKKI
jgi:hypothetical protein